MREDLSDLDTLFEEVIHRYTRAQALSDGVLVDVTEIAREAGFRAPVALTVAAWDKAVAWSDTESIHQTPQNETGRAWDAVWMAYMAVSRASGGCRVPFQLYAVHRSDTAKRPRLMLHMHMHIGPGDDSEPVITIMNPDED